MNSRITLVVAVLSAATALSSAETQLNDLRLEFGVSPLPE